MKVLVVGGGGREHAIIRKLAESPLIDGLYCAPGNGGIAAEAECVPIPATEIEKLADWAEKNAIEYVVVAPDDPLCMGMVDLLKAKGIPAFGPDKAAARVEGSKVYAKKLMRKYSIPTAACEIFTEIELALRYIRIAPCPMVVKADGLALGKGVIICQTRAEAEQAVRDMMERGKFGASGSRVVVEEFLEGPEVSVLVFTDGTAIRPMVSSMDHKRALDGDEGLNTGGMGVIAPNPYYTPDIAATCMQTIFLPTLAALRAEGNPFKGCLYFGLMLTADGPKVIEYNCRFGDPEAQAVLPLLESDLFDIMRHVTDGTLADADVRFSTGASCCVVLASGGYPVSYRTGMEIDGLVEAEALPGVSVFHAGTRLGDAGKVVTAGGRVLGVTAVAPKLPEAIRKAYEAAEKITFTGAHMRRDIGARALKAAENRA
ncbi:MAG: phosphoribosylamine--glycine ligase [Eubacteriales bacterium]|nr:phosphoribosylamine--glycine ligase [Eubacteriales bacterium]